MLYGTFKCNGHSKEGATFEDMFGPSPFTLHGSVGRSGADNHRPDVAKVETFLGDAGYYKPLTTDGPSGWHSTNLDSAIRSFQKDHGLEVDGVLKPGGPTIGKIGSLLGGGAAPAKPEASQAPTGMDFPTDMPWPTRAPKPQPPVDGPDLPGGDIWEKPQPHAGGQDDLEALIRIVTGDRKPEPTGTPPQNPSPGQPRLVQGRRIRFGEIPNDPGDYEWFLEFPDGTRVPTSPSPRNENLGGTAIPDAFPGHTISEAGAKEHDDWAKQLVRDSDPSQTARMLKVAIAEYGDQGRGDVADLLGRFHKIDPAKAETLRRAVKDATGEELPFRVAPVGDGFRELTDEEKLAHAPKSPFGPAHGADRWAAGNMAEVLLGKGDYADAVKHFRTDRSATMPYLAAVHEAMADKSPLQAMKFAGQMRDAGLAMAADAPEPPTPPTTQAPTPPTTPAPVPPPETTAPPTTPEPVVPSAPPEPTPSSPAAPPVEPGEQEANAAQAARVLLNSGAATAAGAMLLQKWEEWRKKGDKPPQEGAGPANGPQMQPAEPVPPVPGLEPPDMPKGGKTELIPPTVKLDGYDTPIPHPEQPNILIFPAQPVDPQDGILENRKGSPATKADIDRWRDEFLASNAGWEHFRGGRRQKTGEEISEYHIPGLGGRMGNPHPGGGYTDLTFKTPDGKFVHVQTVDIDPRTSKPTQRELDNADRIRRRLADDKDENGNRVSHDIILVPKRHQLPKSR